MGIPMPEVWVNNYFIDPVVLDHIKKINSSAQYCEDLILYALLNFKKSGFYIDIGANNPSIISNTEFFYNLGWSGINIEPDPHLLEKFEIVRSRDINLNLGIGSEHGELDFYRLSADTLSTFSKDAVKEYINDGHKILDILKVPVRSLAEVFKEHAEGKDVDFMSIDVEGFEIEVLNSNDWNNYRPKIIILEINQNPTILLTYLNSIKYKLVFNNQTNAIFLDLGIN